METGFLENSIKQKIHYYLWHAAQPRVFMFIVHGVGEHAGRYDEFAQFLMSHGCSVGSCDMRGHGHSDGARGHIRSFADYSEDVALGLGHCFQAVRERNNAITKVFLCAHSLGALIALRVLNEHSFPFAGLILSGPPFEVSLGISSWAKRISVLLSSLIPALLVREKKLQVNLLSHDKEKVNTFRTDPLRHESRSLTFIREYFKEEKYAFRRGADLNVPLLIVQGGEDGVVNVRKVEEFYRTVAFPEKKLIIYPDMYHEVLNELDRMRVYHDIIQWISTYFR